jgi:hypothetical protein
MARTRECCATCKWREFENISDGYVCVNSDSEYVADWVENNHVCDQWEGKGEVE